MLPLRILQSGGRDRCAEKQLKFSVTESMMGVYKKFGGCNK